MDEWMGVVCLSMYVCIHMGVVLVCGREVGRGMRWGSSVWWPVCSPQWYVAVIPFQIGRDQSWISCGPLPEVCRRMLDVVSRARSPLVHCHNDLHYGNILHCRHTGVCVCACVCMCVACHSMWAFLTTCIHFMSLQISYGRFTWSTVVSTTEDTTLLITSVNLQVNKSLSNVISQTTMGSLLRASTRPAL